MSVWGRGRTIFLVETSSEVVGVILILFGIEAGPRESEQKSEQAFSLSVAVRNYDVFED